uniref:Hypothetical Type II secretion protein n=1 Tax=Vibrio sp. 23023 TaxID=452803 RepID=A9M4S3_9VIBR|nr:ATPase, T2SS/T4P/T4SS family [Vibrio sp. 23023]ABX77025.1 Hypothetical Type II secretion protein [Vibrio sp. 23023]
METLLLDEQLKTFYFDNRTTIALESGAILTSRYDSPSLVPMRDYLTNNKTLLSGKFRGVLPTVTLVSQERIDTLLDLGLNHDKSQVTTENDSYVAQRYRDMLTKAANLGSSDIHIELYEHETQILVGVDGRRVFLYDPIPEHDYGERLFSYIFTSAATEKDDDYVARNPNNGRLEETLIIDGERRETIWRASYIPANRGGKVTLRWLNANVSLPSLDDLGWNEGHVAQMRRYLTYPSGVCIISGKTGSGKSTALASALSEIDKTRAVHTLEDPIEFDLGIMQTTVSPDRTIHGESDPRGYGFYSKVLLRHALDVEMHGECRDEKGAMELVRKGETGQLMFTTLHTSSAIGIAHTLTEQMHIPPAVIAAPDLMRLWICQTLVRTLCPHCKMTHEQAKHYHTEHGTLARFTALADAAHQLCDGEVEQVRYRHEQGCNACKQGEKGRTAIVEMIVLDDEDRHFILNKDYLNWQTALKKKGFKDLKWHAMTKIKTGWVDIETASTRINHLLPLSSQDIYQTFSSSPAVPSLGDTHHEDELTLNPPTLT